MKTWATITYRQFYDQLRADHDFYLAHLEIGAWMWRSFAFDDRGCHYLGAEKKPPAQPEMCRMEGAVQ